MSSKNYFNSIALNNEGCEHLEIGDFQSARHCFRGALQFMTVAIVEAQKEMQQLSQPLDDCERLSELQWSNLPCIPLHATAETFIYQRGVVIYRTDEDDFGGKIKAPTPFELSEESSMIVYNLGLSFHLLAMISNKSLLLNEALNFYKIAESIRSRRNRKSSPELIDLAIYNNLGSIHYEAVDYEAARMCFNALKRGLIFFSREGLMDLVAVNDTDGFVLNASMQPVTLAAAA